MDRDELLRRIKAPLAEHYGVRLRGIVLYGSEARGDAGPDSDIDVFVLLNGPVEWWEETKKIIDILYPLVLEIERPIHATPVQQEVFEAQEFAVYRAAKREGIAA